MQPGINIEEVKKYNASLREYKDKSTKIRAELEFNEQELLRQCAELSKELGIEVTPDNIRDILSERISKINNTMQVGNEILNRIKAEEASMSSINSVQQTIPTAQPMTQPVTQAVQTPVQSPSVPPSQIPAPNFSDISGDLPPIFANGQNKINI